MNRRRYVGTTAAALAVLGGGSATASATSKDGDDKADGKPDSGVIEVDECRTIDEPGYYRLTEDLDGDSDESCIEILSDDVVFDGDGNTISGANFAVEINEARGVVVRDLSVDETAVGVFVEECRECLVSNCDISEVNNAVVLTDSSDCIVDAVSGEEIDRFGVLADEGDRNVVRDCQFTGGGIRFSLVVDRSIIAYNEVSNAAQVAGISISEDGDENTVVANRVTDSQGSGIRLFGTDRNTVVRNESTDNDGFGIELEEADENVVANNILEDNDEGPCSVVDSEDNVFVGNEPPCEPDE